MSTATSTATRSQLTRLTRAQIATATIVAVAAMSGCSVDIPGTTANPGNAPTSPAPTATVDPRPGSTAGQRTAMPLGGALTTAPGTRILGHVGTTGANGEGAHGWYVTLSLSPRTEPAAVVAFYRQQLTTAGFEVTDSGPAHLRAFSASFPSPGDTHTGAEDADPDASGSPADGVGSLGSEEGAEDTVDAGSSAGAVPAADLVQPGTYVDIDVARASKLVPGYVRVLSTTR